MRILLVFMVVMSVVCIPSFALGQTPVETDGSGYGPGLSLLPEGKTQGVEVVATGSMQNSGFLPVVVRNNSRDNVYRLSARVRARNGVGKLVNSGDAYNFVPDVIPPGGIAIGIAVMDENAVDGVTYDVVIEDGGRDRGQIALVVVDAKYDRDAGTAWSSSPVTGTYANPSDRDVETVYGLMMCIGDDGEIVAFGPTDQRDVISGGDTASFRVGMLWYGPRDQCEHYVIAARAEYITD